MQTASGVGWFMNSEIHFKLVSAIYRIIVITAFSKPIECASCGLPLMLRIAESVQRRPARGEVKVYVSKFCFDRDA